MNTVGRDCEKFAEKILNGDMESPDVLLHLQNCEQCREMAEDIRFFKSIPQGEQPSPPERLDAIIKKAAADAVTEKSKTRSRIIPFLLWAGGVAAVFALSFQLIFFDESVKPAQTSGTVNLAMSEKTFQSSDWDMSELNTGLAELYSESMDKTTTVDLAKNTVSTTKLEYDYAMFAKQDHFSY